MEARTFRRRRWVVGVLLAAFALLMSVGTASAAAGGPVVLMGIDAEDGGAGAHGPISVYVDVTNSVLGNVTNGGSGILVIGGGKLATDNVTSFWNAVGVGTGEAVTYVNGAAAIAAQSFGGFAIVAVASDQFNTPFGGLTNAENDALTARANDVATHVNNGGGLIGFSSCALTTPYGYLGTVGVVSCALSEHDNITPTPAGLAIGITDALDICCWHDNYTAFPSFLDVLATDNGLFGGGGTGRPSALGGAQVIITQGITLSPDDDTNPAGSSHTVTAVVEDSLGDPVVGTLVSFEVISGPNAGEVSAPGECSVNADCTTDASGEVSWSYTSNGLVGTDEIVATFVDAEGEVRRSNVVAKRWVDSTPPDPSCIETVNPNGNNVPRAGQNSPGQNEDGFYMISAVDNTDPGPQVFVRDNGSGTVFGPYPSGTNIKWTEANGVTPNEKSIGSANGNAGAVTVHIQGTGDAEVFAVDANGNVSGGVACLVPPPPK